MLLELGQLALVLGDLAWCLLELLAQCLELAVAVVSLTQEGQGLFQGGLDGSLFGFGQLAFGQAVEAGLYLVAAGYAMGQQGNTEQQGI